jgi:hypothetical protein
MPPVPPLQQAAASRVASVNAMPAAARAVHVSTSGVDALAAHLSPSRAAASAAALTALTLALHAGLYLGGIAMVGTTYMDIDPILQQNNILTPAAVFGIGFWFLGLLLGPLSLGLALLALARVKGAHLGSAKGGRAAAVTDVAVAGAACGLFAVSLTVVFWSWGALVQAGQTFAVNFPDSLRQFLGGTAVALYIPVAVMAAYVLVTGWCGQGPRPHQLTGTAANLPRVAALLALLAAVAASTTMLCCIWNFHAAGCFASPSTYSLLDYNLQWVLGPEPDPSSGFVQAVIFIKLYADVAVYFGLLGALVTLGFTALQVPALRRFLHTRIGNLLPGQAHKAAIDATLAAGKDASGGRGTLLARSRARLRTALLAWLAELCVGEATVIAAVAGLYAYWFWFFSTGYPRITQEVLSYNDGFPNLHIYARVMGHMTTLTMSFLTFPVTRNSVWEAAFGIPFERAIKHHRALGRLCWLLVTAHMLMWQVKWLAEGSLLNNVVTIRGLEVSPCANLPLPHFANNFTSICMNGPGHYDNFTVPLAEAAWLLLTGVLFVAQFYRRKNYPLFQYTHHAVFLFFLAALIHGA